MRIMLCQELGPESQLVIEKIFETRKINNLPRMVSDRIQNEKRSP